MTMPNRPSVGDPNTRISTSIVPRMALKRVKTFARTISVSVRLVRSPASFTSPRATRSATSAAVSPVGAVRGRSAGAVAGDPDAGVAEGIDRWHAGDGSARVRPGAARRILYEMGKFPLEGGADSADAGPDDGDLRPVPAGARAGPGPRGRVHRACARSCSSRARSPTDRVGAALRALHRDPRGARAAAQGAADLTDRDQPVAVPRRRRLARRERGDGRLGRPGRRRRPAACGARGWPSPAT